MNRIYRLVWNRTLRMLQVASEFAHSHGGSVTGEGPSPMRKHPLALACALVLGLALGANPQLAAAQPVAPAGSNASGSTGGAGSISSNSGGNGGSNHSNGGSGGGTAGSGGGGGVNNSHASGGTSTGGGSGGIGYGYRAWASGGGGGGGGGLSSAGYGGGGGGGANSGNGSGGGGGGGASLGVTLSGATTISANVSGGAGGNGANGSGGNSYSGSGGGGGGGGGAGALLATSGYLTNTATIAGGAGGNGGSGVGFGGSGGGGGGGGSGLLMSTSSTLDNTGTLQGGNGGTGTQRSGGGGSGIYAAGNDTINNHGTISGGLNGGVAGQYASAIQFNGTGNTLNLYTGSTINGALQLLNGSAATIAAQNTGLTLSSNILLGTGAAVTTDTSTANLGISGVISGSGTLTTQGTGTLTLTGANTYSGGTTISGGTLQVGNGGTSGSLGTGAVTDNASLVFDQSSNGTFANAISLNNGTLSQNGPQIVTLTGAIAVNGSSTLTVNSGSLQFGDGTHGSFSDNASSTINLNGNVAVNFDLPGNATVASSVIGAGSLAQDGTGTITLTGANTYSGSTVVNAGTLALSGSGSIANSADVTLASGSTFDISGVASGASVTSLNGSGTANIGGKALTLTGASGTFAGAINGNGSVSVNTGSSASYIYNGTSTGVAWTVAGGNLQVGDSATSSTGTITAPTFTDNANVLVDGAGSSVTATASNMLVGGSGTGMLTVQNGALVHSNNELEIGQLAGDTGTVTVTGSGSTLSTGTSINIGQSGTGTLIVSAGGTVSDNGYFSIADKAGTSAQGQVTVTGAGSSVTALTVAVGNHANTGSGTLTLADGGSITATNGFYIAADAGVVGTVNIGAAAGSAAAAPGTLNANTVAFGNGTGTLVFNHTSTGYTFAPQVTGAGAVEQVAGTTIFTADNTYSGATTISGGTLQVGNGGTSGSLGTGAVTDNGSLIFNRSDAVDFTNSLAGTGNLVQQGSGTLAIDSNNNWFLGSTTVASGTLIVGSVAGNGADLGGSVTVDNGATLGGHGTIGGSVDVLTGGNLTPGNSIGTLTVRGNLTAAQGSVLDFDIGAPGANFQTAGSSDSVQVGGNLELDGATLNLNNAGGMGPGLYTLFTWGGTLTENNGGLTLGTTPAGQNVFLQTLTAQQQINLIDTTGYSVNVWNANGQASSTQMGGGSGTWSATSPVWTDATGTAPNGPMSPQPGFAIFGGTAGTVTVDDGAGQVSVTGMQFAVNGYTLTGDTLTLVANNGTAPIIRVGDGSSQGASMTATINNVIAGSDGLTKTDFGTLVLAGANTYTGTTTVDGGTLEVAAGSAAGSGITVDNSANQNATLQVDSGTTLNTQVTLANGGVLDNAGSVSNFVGVTSTSATDTVDNHGGGSISGFVGVFAQNGGTIDNSGQGTSIGGAIAGVFANTPVTVNNTGGAMISGQLGLSLAAGGTIFNGSGSTIASTTPPGGNCASGVGASVIGGGCGSIKVTGSGALTLTNAGTLVGDVQMDPTAANLTTLVAGGTIQGNLVIGTNTASTLTLDGSNTTAQTYSQAVTGTTTFDGTLYKRGSGTWIIDNNDLASVAGTTINAGTLQVGNGGTTGSIGNGNARDNGTLAFDRSDNVGYAGNISGTGGLTQLGTGTLKLTGANTYTGGTTIRTGTLQVGNGSTTGSIGNGNVSDNGALVFDRSDTINFSSTISGSGMLTQQGSGTLIINGDSSAFTGTTAVHAGTLEVGDANTPQAVLGGDVSVANGATLRGHGTIGGNVANDGIVWAGGSIGTLTIDGNYTQSANGTLEVEATPSGQSSLLAVKGTATLAGSALVLADTGNWAPRTDYTILTATGGVSGQFASASVNFAFLNPVLTYQTNDVLLSLERNDISFTSVTQTPNQKAVATTTNAMSFGNPIYDTLVVLDAPTARQAFDQLSGEIHASTRTAIMDNDHYVRDAINQHLVGQSNDANGLNVTDADGVTAWTSTWGHWGSHKSDGNASMLHDNGSGLLFGVDMPVGDAARLGAVLGTGQGSAGIDTLDSSAHIIDQHLGLYGSAQTGSLLWRGAAIYGWQKVDTHRYLGFGTFAGAATSSYHAHTAQAYVDGSLPFVQGNTTLAPFANLAVEHLSTPNISENGSAAALDVAAQDSTVGYGTLGLRASFDLGAPDHGLHAHASLGWQHAWGDLSSTTSMRFASGGNSFDISGVPVMRNAAAASLGISFTIAPKVSVDGTYQGQFGKQANDQSARISLDWKF